MPSLYSKQRAVRVFLSSTFRDFGEERDLLVRKVFPALRARLAERFVDLVDVDLRWGITESEAEQGAVLPICLAEIDNARPFFIGLLGERYGWTPPTDIYPDAVLEQYPWLEKHRGTKSVTELEILHGVLNNPVMAGRAMFYFRSSDYAKARGGDFIALSPQDQAKQDALKNRVRVSEFPVIENYATPEEVAERIQEDLWSALEIEFPETEVPDAFTRDLLQHEAYAFPRRRIYLGGDAYLDALDQALANNVQWIHLNGESGSGKSALLANWINKLKDEDLILHVHYVGANPSAADPVAMVRRIIEWIRREIGSYDQPAADPQELFVSLPEWLSRASAWAEINNKRFMFVLDALNGISDRRDLRWFPRFLPANVFCVISTLPGETQDNLMERAPWRTIYIHPLEPDTGRQVFVTYLSVYNKTLPEPLIDHVMAHPLMMNPLFLMTLAEELRLFGEHEQLSQKIAHYQESITVDDLFERVLARIESDHGSAMICKIMTALWASRSGLREEELLAYTGLPLMRWSYIRHAFGPALIESNGRYVFAHDYLRIAVSDRYMAGNNTIENEGQNKKALKLRQEAHIRLAKWFEAHAFQGNEIVGDARAAEEIPYHWQQAKEWERLTKTLTQLDMFIAITEHLQQQELLDYWLTIEAKIKTDIEVHYERAWSEWKLNENKEASVAQKLGWFLQHAGYVSFPEKLFQKSLNSLISIYGLEHEFTSTGLGSLGLLLHNKGNDKAAEPLLRQALKIRKKNAPEHEYTADSYNNLASLLDDKGDDEEAEILYKKSLEIREKTLGLEHPDTANSLMNLGIFLLKKGDDNSAEKLLRQSLQIKEKILGPNHPDTALGLNNMAEFLRDIGDYEAAEPLYRRSLHIYENNLGLEHPMTALALGNLAGLLSDKEDDTDAEVLIRLSLKIYENSLGPDHIETARTLENLGGCLLNQGDSIGAERHYRKAHEIKEKSLGLEHPFTIESLNKLGELIYENGDQYAAENIYRKCLSIRQKILGHNHLDTAESLHKLALVLFEKGEFETSETLLIDAERIASQELGEDYLYMIISLMSSVLFEQKKYLEAEEYFQKLLQFELQEFDHNGFEVAATYSYIGECQFYQAKFADAEQSLANAYTIQSVVYGEDDPDLVRVVDLLAKSLDALGK